MELVDILVLGTSAARRAGSNPAEGIYRRKATIFSPPPPFEEAEEEEEEEPVIKITVCLALC
jgi:hypothetical protein